MEELGDVVFIVQLWVQQRLACSERRRKKVLREDKIVGSWQWAIGSWQGKKESEESWPLARKVLFGCPYLRASSGWIVLI